MFVHTHAFALDRGGAATRVTVELDARAGLPSFNVIGVGGTAGRELRERVHAAVLNAGYGFPRQRLTANLTPAGTGSRGAEFDLAVACCVLASSGALEPGHIAQLGLCAELGLGSQLRGCAQADVVAAAAERAGLRGLVVSADCAEDARSGGCLPILGAHDLRSVVERLGAATSSPHGTSPRAQRASHK